MATISLKFAKKNGKFCLCAMVVGSATRHYKIVPMLKNANFSKWDSNLQMFLSNSPEDLENNVLLKKFIAPFEQALKDNCFENGKELFEFCEREKKEKELETIIQQQQQLSLGDFLRNVINDLRNPTKRKPSANFQTYTTLLHKLEKEGRVIKTPVSKVDRNTLMRFSNWVLHQKGLKGTGNNYVALMKLMIATINRARKAGLTDWIPAFPYMDYAPVINSSTGKAADMNAAGGTVKSLNQDQYRKFTSLDLDLIKLRHPSQEYYKQLYKDYCVLLYELKSRPMDVMKLHWSNIAFNEQYQRWVCTYIPSKKKNYSYMRKSDTNHVVVQFLTDRAMEIIMKYKGTSPTGYVLPFSFNKKRWDMDNPEQYYCYYAQQNRMQGRINRFLGKVGGVLELPFKLTIYAFRRTSITKAITDNQMPIAMIAKVAGTSVGMIERHYVNYLDALAAYR